MKNKNDVEQYIPVHSQQRLATAGMRAVEHNY
jgi:hypothetical protein